MNLDRSAHEVSPGSSSARAALFDEEFLAQRARTTLAGSDQARLVVADGGPRVCGEYQVTVRDDDGEPILLVPCGGVLWQVARRRCHAALMLAATAPDGVGVTLVGRLIEQPEAAAGLIASAAICEGGCQPVTGTACPGWTAVALIVQRVHTSCPRAEVRIQTKPRREIPLELYAMAEPDVLAASIPWIVRHLNGAHHAQVRAIAARCARLPLDDVIGAEVSLLTDRELRLWWVGLDGASPIRICFPMPVHSVDELGALIRGYLDSASA